MFRSLTGSVQIRHDEGLNWGIGIGKKGWIARET